MSEAIRDLPDALVLGAGGTLGEAWLRGLLGGLEAGAGLDFSACEYLLGTSAGSIVAATLAAGRRPEAGEDAVRAWARAAAQAERDASDSGRAAALALDGSTPAADVSARGQEAGPPGPDPSARGLAGTEPSARGPEARPEPSVSGRALGAVGRGAGRIGRAVATPFAPLALATTTPAGRLARAAVLRRAPRPERTLGGLGAQIDALGARFDGRLRIVAVDRASGRRVIFGAPDAPRATVGEAVLASCAVPWVFAPVEIDGREYVDGAVWSPTNLDAVPAGRGSRVLCLIPTAGTAVAPLRTFSAAAAGYEGMALTARGAEVRTVVPDPDSLDAIGPDLMNPSRRARVAAAGYAQGRRLT